FWHAEYGIRDLTRTEVQPCALAISADRIRPQQDAAAAGKMRALPIQIKICGITNARDAKACIDFGAQMIGLNFYPQSARYIQPEVARQIVQTLPTNTRAAGVFV